MGTFGVGPCVAIAGIDKTNNICFVGDFDGMTQVPFSLGSLCYRMINTFQLSKMSFEVMLVSGSFDESSQTIVDDINYFIQNSMPKEITMSIVETQFSSSITESLGVDMTSKNFCTVKVVNTPESKFDFDLHVCELLHTLLEKKKTPAFFS